MKFRNHYRIIPPTLKDKRLLASVLLMLCVLWVLCPLGMVAHAQDADPATPTAVPPPLYVSLRAHKVHLRIGPGLQYPIEWIYQRKNLPLEVIGTYKDWRKVRDWEGTQGWIHRSLLSTNRTVIIIQDRTPLYRYDAHDSPITAYLEETLVGFLQKDCANGIALCEIKTKGYRGWVNRALLWGL